MANEEQLAILRQGVEVWNSWREENPDLKIDLTEADLGKSKLAGVNFSKVRLRNANLFQADLSGANLSYADLREANLSRAYLRGADLTRADLRSANFSKADLSDAIFTKAILNGYELDGVDITGVIFEKEHKRLSRGVKTKIIESVYQDEIDRTEQENPSPQNEVSFTAIYPKEGRAEIWHTLLVYVHLLSAIEDVHQDVKRFKDQIPVPKEVTSSSSTPIVRGTEITIIPSCEGIEFNPKNHVVKWMEKYHRADFRFRADKSLTNDAAKGQINIYVGPINVGTVKFALLINETDTKNLQDLEEQSKMYRQEDIFVSYSHKDTDVVLACKKAYDALGFNVLIDADTLRSGQAWNEELMRMIDRATIFQLFWSQNSCQSEFCQQEWRHALKQNKEGFIRPFFWENPMPEPPEELSRLHFDYVDF